MDSSKQSIKTVIKETKKRRCRRHCRRHRSTRNIHQKIELNKQDFQCVINLNTTICEHEATRSQLNTKICSCVSHRSNRVSCRAPSLDQESRQVSSLNREPTSLESQCYGRGKITPYCFRNKCQSLVLRCRCRDERRDHVNNMMAKHHHYNSGRNHRRDSTGAKRLRDRHRKHRNDTLKLSPISSSPLKDDLNHLYEDISNDSLDEFLKTPMSYKNIRYVEDKVESKLDTLIRRTKERERKLVAESRNKRSYSISTTSNISSGECPMDLETMDTVSLASRATLVLENSQSDCIYLSSEVEKSPEYSQNDFHVKKYKYRQLCSPESSSKTDEYMNIPMKYEREQVNSPQSFLQRDFIVDYSKKDKYSELCSLGSSSKNDLNMNITRKYEREEIYSPGSPIQNYFIKNDPKIHENRRLCSPGSSSKNDLNITKKYECEEIYSPGSPIQNDFIKNDPKIHENRRLCSPGSSSKNDLNMNITKKYEREEIYSPGSPIQDDFIKIVPKKHEYKQLCSPGPSSENDFNMKILKKYEHKQRYSRGSPLQGDFIKKDPKKHEYKQMCSTGPSSKNDFNMNILKTSEHKQRYSPSSPLQDDFVTDFAKKHDSDFKIIYIKSEPMNIGTYSPTFNYSKEEIKKEIKVKSEPFESTFNIKKEME